MKDKTANKEGARPKTLGIPRTHGEAKKLGYAEKKIKFEELGDEIQSRFIPLTQTGARKGSLCGLGPSPTPGHVLVCYKSEGGFCTWVDVPTSSLPPPGSH